MLRGQENGVLSGAWYNTVRVWDAESFACVEIIEGIYRDLAVIGHGSTQFPWHAIFQGPETVIEEAATGQPAAWFPAAPYNIATSPAAHTWAGAVGNYLCLIQLGGDAFPTRSSQFGSAGA